MSFYIHLMFIFLSIVNINAQMVYCKGGTCTCPSKSGQKCILNCASTDICKQQTLNCRTGDECEIRCDAKASCSDGAQINAETATDVTIICSAEDSCKAKINIRCGKGDCKLICDKGTSCEDWGNIDVRSSKSFACIGKCPQSLPSPFSPSPTTSPTATPTDSTFNPTITPTQNPSLSPTHNPTQSTMNPTVTPTDDPTSDPTRAPTTNPTSDPTHIPTNNPTFDPTANPTPVPTKQPSSSPTMRPTSSPSYRPSKSPSNPSISPTNIPTQTPIIRDAPNLTARNEGAAKALIAVISILSIALFCISMALIHILYSRHQRAKKLSAAFGDDDKQNNNYDDDNIVYINHSPTSAQSAEEEAKSSEVTGTINAEDYKIKRTQTLQSPSNVTQNTSNANHAYIMQLIMQNRINGQTPGNQQQLSPPPTAPNFGYLPNQQYYHSQHSQRSVPWNPIQQSPPSTATATAYIPSYTTINYGMQTSIQRPPPPPPPTTIQSQDKQSEDSINNGMSELSEVSNSNSNSSSSEILDAEIKENVTGNEETKPCDGDGNDDDDDNDDNDMNGKTSTKL